MENEQTNIGVFPGVIDTLKSAWKIYKQRFWVIVKLVLIPIATVFILGAIGAIAFILLGGVIFGGLPGSNWATGLSGATLIIAIAMFLIFLIAAVVIGAWSQIALLVAIKDRQENIRAQESLRRAWPKIKSYFWVTILSALIIMAGFVLAIVPGIIFMVWFSLAMYVFISEDIKGMDALLKSKEYVRGRWGSVFWRFFGFWLLVVAASIVLWFIPIISFFSGLISIFVFTPMGVIYGFLVYNNVKILKGEFEFVPQKRGWFIAAAILGTLIIPVMIFGTISLVALNSAREKARDIKQQNETNAVLSDKTAWQTYRNEKYGFEVKYPNNWHFDTFGLLASAGTFELTTLPRSAYGQGGVLPTDGAEITILNTNLSLVEAINQDSRGAQIIKQDSINVVGIKATRIIYKIDYTPLPKSAEKMIIVYIPYQSELYKFILYFNESDPKELDYIKIFETILSTFKFIK